ncbi:MAG: hypothetical protein JWO93_2630 [Micrococcaceae bacterium]|jgi:hypothetical protein|nr:hypothetical protein [Micrococcaceae bacterium]
MMGIRAACLRAVQWLGLDLLTYPSPEDDL